MSMRLDELEKETSGDWETKREEELMIRAARCGVDTWSWSAPILGPEMRNGLEV